MAKFSVWFVQGRVFQVAKGVSKESLFDFVKDINKCSKKQGVHVAKFSVWFVQGRVFQVAKGVS